MQSAAFLGVKLHTPLGFPFSQSVEILTQDGTVFRVSDWSVNFTIMCKRTSLNDLVRKVIYKQQEE